MGINTLPIFTVKDQDLPLWGRDYDPVKHSVWSQGVLRKTNFCCFLTGTKEKLQCHHLTGWWNEPTRHDIKNGVALAQKVHSEFHNAYGRGYNTLEQFLEFCRKQYNVTEFPNWLVRQGNHKPNFTLEEEQKKYLSYSAVKNSDFKKTVTERNHEIKTGTFVTNKSILVITCLKHNCFQEIIAGNYKKSKVGLKCCAREGQCRPRKKVLMNKEVS